MEDALIPVLPKEQLALVDAVSSLLGYPLVLIPAQLVIIPTPGCKSKPVPLCPSFATSSFALAHLHAHRL